MNKDVISMSKAGCHGFNKNPADSLVSDLSTVVKAVTKFQAALASWTKQTSISMALLINYLQACNEEVHDDI